MELNEKQETSVSASYLINKRQKYIDAELNHFRTTKEKSKTLREK